MDILPGFEYTRCLENLTPLPVKMFILRKFFKLVAASCKFIETNPNNNNVVLDENLNELNQEYIYNL